MESEITLDSRKQSRRWLGYFDLLGTRKIIESSDYPHVFSVYSRAVEKARRLTANSSKIEHVCFSDTILIYSNTDSVPEFAFMDQVARWFVHGLILDKIPVRGAISCGDFYADRKNELYFGPALVEAYEYGEAQDWLGFLLTPTAVSEAEKIGLPPSERLNYAYGPIPYKETASKDLVRELPACILGRWITINGRNLCADAISEMSSTVSEPKHRSKYLRTLEFIEKNKRMPVVNEGNVDTV